VGAQDEVPTLCPIHLFDRDHPSVPTCARAWPSRAAAVKDGALQRHRRLVLDRREHGGMLAVQRDKEKRRRGAHPTELFQLMLGFLLRAALELMKSPTDSLEDPYFLKASR
jgi:hypothetical protein